MPGLVKINYLALIDKTTTSLKEVTKDINGSSSLNYIIGFLLILLVFIVVKYFLKKGCK